MGRRTMGVVGVAALALTATVVALQAPRIGGGAPRGRSPADRETGKAYPSKAHVARKAIPAKTPGFMQIPAGDFERGDHHGFVDPQHGSDEVPLRTIRLDGFAMGINDVTTQEYCEFLNSALQLKQIEVRRGGVYLVGGSDLLCETRGMSPFSRINWDEKSFTVLGKKEDHPMVCVRWHGAAAYCNWLSAQKNLPRCYDAATWECDFNKSGFRLPTEAEWEYAARGGQQDPYRTFPWGDQADRAKANWPESENPYREGQLPWTTPVGFFDGQLHRKSDFGWPGSQQSFHAANGVNGYGLNDMAGNVWQWCTEWYERNYYAYCPNVNPPGPAEGSLMPDGKPYRVLRGGNWFNGEYGHSRVSNRDPSYFRGPEDPNHPFYHIGFRVVLPSNAESRPLIKATPVQRMRPGDDTRGGQPSPEGKKLPRRKPRPGDDRGDSERRGGDQRGNAEDRPSRDDSLQVSQTGENERTAAPARAASSSTGFVLRSPEVTEGGTLPKEYTGDGSSSTLPLKWSGAPVGTQSYALIMHHIAPDGIKWYWVLYNIPAEVNHLPKNERGVGTFGNNSINHNMGYAPPHSQGPGAKKYTYTLYALSAPPRVSTPPAKVDRATLLSAIKGLVLASAELNVTYTRDFGAESSDRPPPSGKQGAPKKRRA